MPNLTDAQLVILAKAAQRSDGAVLPLPRSLGLNRGAAGSVLSSLLRHGLVREQPATRNDPVWRTAKGENRTLIITGAGLAVIGVAPGDSAEAPSVPVAAAQAESPARQAEKPSAGRATPTAKTGTRQALLIDLLKRRTGTTIGEMAEATGWQAHSVRGAISGTLRKKHGLEVTSETVEGRGRVYRIAGRG